MSEQKNQLQTTAKDMLVDQLTAEQNALPKDFNMTRFVQNALSVVQNNAGLAGFADRKQVISGLIKGAYLGLDFMSNECYLIPYGNNLRFQMSYIGKKKFVKKYAIRPILDIYAKVVREGDKFTENIVNGQPSIDFSPIPFNDSPEIGAFAVVLYKDGGMEYESMSKTEINDIRKKYSKTADAKAWKDSWGEMAKKTVLGRLTKHIEVDFESVEAHKTWDEEGEFDFKKRETSDIVEDPFAKQEEEAIEVEAVEVEAEQIELPDFLKGDEA
jgi:recombination protein RecT